MNILFCTQSESLRIFDALREQIGCEVPIERAGFTVADSWAYEKWLVENLQHLGRELSVPAGAPSTGATTW